MSGIVHSPLSTTCDTFAVDHDEVSCEKTKGDDARLKLCRMRQSK